MVGQFIENAIQQRSYLINAIAICTSASGYIVLSFKSIW